MPPTEVSQPESPGNQPRFGPSGQNEPLSPDPGRDRHPGRGGGRENVRGEPQLAAPDRGLAFAHARREDIRRRPVAGIEHRREVDREQVRADRVDGQRLEPGGHQGEHLQVERRLEGGRAGVPLPDLDQASGGRPEPEAAGVGAQLAEPGAAGAVDPRADAATVDAGGVKQRRPVGLLDLVGREGGACDRGLRVGVVGVLPARAAARGPGANVGRRRRRARPPRGTRDPGAGPPSGEELVAGGRGEEDLVDLAPQSAVEPADDRSGCGRGDWRGGRERAPRRRSE